MSTEGLPEGYELREVPRFDDAVIAELVEEVLNRGSGVFQLARSLPDQTRADLLARREGQPKESVCTLHVGIWHGEELVAWSYSKARSPSSLIMMASGVREAHRRKGLYTLLLRHVRARAVELGFEVIESFHNASNNPILIAKLREGWHVAGIQQSLYVGLLVQLETYLLPEHEALYHVRTGWRPPSAYSSGLLPSAPSGPLPAPNASPRDVDDEAESS